MFRSLLVILFVAWALWRFPVVLAPLGVSGGPGLRILIAFAIVGLFVGLTLARDAIHNGLVEDDRRRAHAEVDEEHNQRARS